MRSVATLSVRGAGAFTCIDSWHVGKNGQLALSCWNKFYIILNIGGLKWKSTVSDQARPRFSSYTHGFLLRIRVRLHLPGRHSLCALEWRLLNVQE
jgi:hypothetical protein